MTKIPKNRVRALDKVKRIDVLITRMGMTVGDACKTVDLKNSTYYRLKREAKENEAKALPLSPS